MLLAKDGIFPITKDHEGNPLVILPASGLDIPGTIQGEGKLCGIPSLFVRLAGCNLKCCWTTADKQILSPCDTAYAAYQMKDTRELPADEIYAVIRHNSDYIRHIVITGGEPFLQATELRRLCFKLKQSNYHITIESNATIFDPEVAQYIDLFSLSPKLSGSQPDNIAYSPDISIIKSFLDFAIKAKKEFQLKFVYSGKADIPQIQQLLSKVEGWKNEDILLMPLGSNPETMRINIREALSYCIRYGWRYCDRLHISLFGNKPGI